MYTHICTHIHVHTYMYIVHVCVYIHVHILYMQTMDVHVVQSMLSVLTRGREGGRGDIGGSSCIHGCFLQYRV